MGAGFAVTDDVVRGDLIRQTASEQRRESRLHDIRGRIILEEATLSAKAWNRGQRGGLSL